MDECGDIAKLHSCGSQDGLYWAWAVCCFAISCRQMSFYGVHMEENTDVQWLELASAGYIHYDLQETWSKCSGFMKNIKMNMYWASGFLSPNR